MFNLVYNMVYYDKYKYEKIDFEKVAVFFAPDCIKGNTKMCIKSQLELAIRDTFCHFENYLLISHLWYNWNSNKNIKQKFSVDSSLIEQS